MARRVFTEENEYEEDLDNIDFGNYKGIFYDDDPTSKYQDPDTGAHFDFTDISTRLSKIKQKRLWVNQNKAETKMSAKEKLWMQLNMNVRGAKGNSKHARVETEYSDPEDDEMSILDEHYSYEKENINDSNMDEHFNFTGAQHDDMDKYNKELEFKNKFADPIDNNEMLFHRRDHGNDLLNPMLFMNKIHQTEEDEENVELIDHDFELEEFCNFNEDKTNLKDALNINVCYFCA
jgi:hypothetical protein